MGSQPVESQPVESQPMKSQPVESQPVESQPVESQPVVCVHYGVTTRKRYDILYTHTNLEGFRIHFLPMRKVFLSFFFSQDIGLPY